MMPLRPRARSGDLRIDRARRRRRRARARARLRGAAAALSAARAGSSTIPRRSGRRRRRAAQGALAAAGVAGTRRRRRSGITNQRETTIVWDRATGARSIRAIVWQCRRTARALRRAEAPRGSSRSCASGPGSCSTPTSPGRRSAGSSTTCPDARRRAERGAARLRHRRHVARVEADRRPRARHRRHQRLAHAAASNLDTVDWDDEMLRGCSACRARCCPPRRVVRRGRRDRRPRLAAGRRADRRHRGRSAGRALRAGVLRARATRRTPTAPAASSCSTPGRRRCARARAAHDGGVADRRARTTYALEGSVFIAGAAVQWLRDGLGLIATRGRQRGAGASVPDTGGVYFVPAFVGLGAPYWDMYARGTIVGLTRGTTRAHLVRAALEAIAYQSRDVLEAMAADAGVAVRRAARGRRRRGQRLPVPVPGRRPGRGRAAPGRDRDDGARRRVPRRPGRRASGARSTRWRRALDGRADVHARDGRAPARRAYDGWRRAVERARGWARHAEGHEGDKR